MNPTRTLISSVINALNPIKELYDLYSDKEVSLCIVEVGNDGLGFDSDIEDRLTNLYLKL